MKNTELNNFYKLYPEKFNNKTNGITFRRWFMECNPELSSYVTSLIGDGWKKDASELDKLGAYLDDAEVKNQILAIKDGKKIDLKNYLAATQGLNVNPESIFDIQVKRLHEYKRQQLNVLYIIHKYIQTQYRQ